VPAATHLSARSALAGRVPRDQKKKRAVSRAQPSVVAQGAKNVNVTTVNVADAEARAEPSTSVDPVGDYVAGKGGKRPIRKILVANNGMAAAKCIMSMRRWAYLTFGDSSYLRFVVMATPEDLNANAEFIRNADDFIEVPGGKNSNNYANVNLIVNVAIREGVDAVWPGWGHASENPKLPTALTKAGIQFIGPTASVMSVLGDKIAANILAQTAQVPSIPWSGDGLEANLTEEGTIPQDVFEQATVRSAEEAVETATRVGYPIMVKASEGGGGKGIRMVADEAALKNAYLQVVAEVPGSPVFMMQLCSEARHLEVQIVGDEHGNAVAFNGRDCSTQRRFQKIFEEGPPTIADPEVFKQMERSAQRLTQQIGYIGAGTVEYLYNAATKSYFFLELNPRLQVEHPVTEGITGVNLPSLQLQVAMGIPLNRIPDVRRFYGLDPEGDSTIDFMTEDYVLPKKHVIAARITAENPDEGFKPTSGRIDRIRFQSSPSVWGYFSVGTNGAVHEFADSQFGHLFASGETREEARKALVLALKELLVRGEIRTAVEYLEQLLGTPEFMENTIDTSWLDKIIAAKQLSGTTDPQLIVLSAALCRAHTRFGEEETALHDALSKGQEPSRATLSRARKCEVELVYESTKYVLTAKKLAADLVEMRLGDKVTVVRLREQSDGTLLATFGGLTHRLSAQEEPLGMRLELDGKVVLIPTQFDPSELRSDVNGKVVRFLHEEGAEVEKGVPYIEVEAMKMVMPLLTTEGGKISHKVAPGSIIEAGELLSSLTLKDPSRVKKIAKFKPEEWRMMMDPVEENDHELTVLEQFRSTMSKVDLILQGYDHPVEETVQALLKHLSDLELFEGYLNEAVAAVGADMPADLKAKIAAGQIKHGQDLQKELADLKEGILANLNIKPTPLQPLETVVEKFKEGRWGFSLLTFADIVSKYYEVERSFAGKAFDVAARRVKNKAASVPEAGATLLAHHALERRTLLVDSLFGQLSTLPQRCNVSEFTPFPREFPATLKKLGSLQGRNYGEIALVAANIREERKGRPFEQRLSELKAALMGRVSLRRIWDGKESGNSIDSLVTSPTLGVDLLPSLFADKKEEIASRALEVFLRRVYRAHHIESLEISAGEESEPAAGEAVKPLRSADFTFRFRDTPPAEAPLRRGKWLVVQSLANIEENIDAVLEDYAKQVAATEDAPPIDPAVNVLHFAVMGQHEASEVVTTTEAVLAQVEGRLRTLGMRMVNVIVCQGSRPPLHHTFTECLGYKEDPIRRNMRPTFTHLLELSRLSNYNLLRFPTINRDLHIYLGEAKSSAPRRGKMKNQRMFLRRISHSTDFTEGGAERMLTKALDAIELAVRDPRVEVSCPTSLFISIMPEMAGTLDATGNKVEKILSDFIAANATRLLSLRMDEIELKVRTVESDGSHPVSMRIVASSKSGQWLKIDKYKEFPDPVTGMAMYFCTLDNSERCYLEPYTISSDVEVKRAAARRIGTTYVYDFLGLMEKSLIQQWDKYLQEVGAEMERPETLFEFKELGLNENGTVEYIERAVGTNTVAMVGWECRLYTPEAPAGRDVVVIASDVSVKSGSFGVLEDDFFYAVSRYAAEKGMPRMYIACNSGARIGLVDELKPLTKVCWNNPENPSLGFKYLYLDDDVYQSLEPGTVKAMRTEVDGEVRWALSDIIGTVHGIGVENLRGSGMIAGETSRAYTETFTLSYVTGRSVGIGAYLCRLGQRTIQMKNGPMILTGYSALNKLLGRPVYTSQDQLGGPQIMIPNGVSHMQVNDDQEGVNAMLKWISYVPLRVGQLAPQVRTADPVDREVGFVPSKTPYDPRHMLAGVETPEGEWQSGLFDQGSFVETLGGWGKTVVVGRARLGGYPCGIIAVETRSVEQVAPADPATPTSAEVVNTQAGQVWFPDSAFKTATAIKDFNNGEQLPLFIFANWRGFSGGTRDMYNEVLKYGAMIVDALREYKQPVFVYIPPGGELRGGAWVVVDPTINLEQMEMYADEEARGGILEPPGICEVKYRKNDQVALMHRIDPQLIKLDEDKEANAEAIKAREDALLPVYLQIAHEFADLHDRAGRMEAKGVIRKALEWKTSRPFFYNRLVRRLKEGEARRALMAEGGLSHDEATGELKALAGDAYEDDKAMAGMLSSSSDSLDKRTKELKNARIKSQLAELLDGLDPADRSAVISQL